MKVKLHTSKEDEVNFEQLMDFFKTNMIKLDRAQTGRHKWIFRTVLSNHSVDKAYQLSVTMTKHNASGGEYIEPDPT